MKQAGAELGQAQLNLELGRTLISICCNKLMIARCYQPIHITEHNQSVPGITPLINHTYHNSHLKLPKITILTLHQLSTDHLWSISSQISTFLGGWVVKIRFKANSVRIDQPTGIGLGNTNFIQKSILQKLGYENNRATKFSEYQGGMFRKKTFFYL